MSGVMDVSITARQMWFDVALVVIVLIAGMSIKPAIAERVIDAAGMLVIYTAMNHAQAWFNR